MIFNFTVIKNLAKELNYARLNENLNDIKDNKKNMKTLREMIKILKLILFLN